MPELFDILAKGAIDSPLTPVVQVFDDTNWDPIDALSVVVTERGGVTADPVEHSITVQEAGSYEWMATFNVEMAAAEELEFIFFINGVATGRIAKVQGAGAGKPVELTSVGTNVFPAGAVLQGRARNGDVGTVSASFVKAYIQIVKDF